jgi:hypothetical protein
MADWNTPVLTTDYADFLTYLKDRDHDLALMFGGVTATNVPTGAIGIANVSGSAYKFEKFNGASWDTVLVDISGGGTGAWDAAGARNNLGLGSLATQASSAVSITGGSISGVSISGSTGSFSSEMAAQQFAMKDSGRSIYIRQISGTNRIDSYDYPATVTEPLQINASILYIDVADTAVAYFDGNGLTTYANYKMMAGDSGSVDRGYGLIGVTRTGTAGSKAYFSLVNWGRFVQQIGLDHSNGDLLFGPAAASPSTDNSPVFRIGQTGVVTFNSNTWHQSNEGSKRLYFTNAGATYYEAPNSTHIFRTSGDADFFTIIPDASGYSVLLGKLKANVFAMNSVKTMTDGATITMNPADSNIQQVTLGAAGRTFAFSVTPPIGTWIVKLIQDGTGGRTITTWPAAIKWQGGSAPSLSTGANKVDILTLVSDGANVYAALTAGY